jgi:type I restriction enzyme S subunit
VAIKHISITDFAKMPFLLPPLAEQRRIVAEVERRLSVADEVAITVEQSLAQAQRLRQSILKKAFEGKLVAQNPEDEAQPEYIEIGGRSRSCPTDF